MSNPYIPMSTELRLLDLVDFLRRVQDQQDFNYWFEASVDMSARRFPHRSASENHRVICESVRYALGFQGVNRNVRQWLEDLSASE